MATDEEVRLTAFISEHPELNEYPRVKKELMKNPKLVPFFERMAQRYRPFLAINEALITFDAGETITARCPICGGLIWVDKPIYAIWVGCPNGCARAHFQLSRGNDV